MVQTLEVKIEIPPEYALVKKDFLAELENSALEGQWWDMQDLMNHIRSKDPKWVRENILDRYKDLLDVRGNKLRIVFYPGPGQKWKFNAVKMKKFLTEYFSEIWR